MDKVSIIIPCHNQGQYIGESIKSALNQTHSNIEVIVVLDGCTDNSLSECIVFGDKIYIISQPQKGVSAARNVGANYSKGEYLLFLDGDDVLHEKYIEKTLILQKNIVCTNYKEFGLSIRDITFNKPIIENSDIQKRNYIPVTALIKREVFEYINGFDESMLIGFEDWDFWNRATKKYDCHILPETLFFYRKHSISRNKEAFKHLKQIIPYIFRA